MKTNIQTTNYRLVVFQDLNNDASFLVKSTIAAEETIKWSDGQTYPLVKLHLTSASHPYYTGQEKLIDVEGRVDKFKNRQKQARAAKDQLKAKTLKTMKKQASDKPAAEANPLKNLKQSNRKLAPKHQASKIKADKVKTDKTESTDKA